MILRLTILLLSALIFGCTGSEEAPVIELTPPAEGKGFQLSMEYTVPAGEEAWMCMVYPIPADGIAYVNNVQSKQTEGMHHMTLSTLGFGGPELEYGIQPCPELLDGLMEDLLSFFGSGGESEESLTLPTGIAAALPEGIDIIHEIHYVNTTEEPVHVKSVVNAYTIEPEEVVDSIWGEQVRDEFINIPAASEHTEWTRCVMNRPVDVLFVASHTHQLGTKFDIALFDGVTAGDIFYTSTDWHTSQIQNFEQPIHLEAGEGFEFTCTWNNPTDAPIEYGSTANDEMCNLALVYTPFDQSARCDVVETSDGVLWVP